MERRRYKRIKKDFKICIIEKQANKINIINLRKTGNVSASGILIDYEESLNVDTIIKIQFLDQNSFIFFENAARVIRAEKNPGNHTYRIGIEFINISRKDKKKLEHYLMEE